MRIRTHGALVLGLSVGAFGQPAPASLAFEAASVKPSAQGGRGRTLTTDPSGRFMAERATLRMLVTFAAALGTSNCPADQTGLIQPNTTLWQNLQPNRVGRNHC